MELYEVLVNAECFNVSAPVLAETPSTPAMNKNDWGGKW